MNSDSVSQSDLEAIERARRLEELGFTVKSESLINKAQDVKDFNERGGNRAMRRAAKRRHGH